jgi:hypothetical protein
MSEASAETPEAKLAGKGAVIKLVRPATLRDSLSIQAWAEKEISEPERLLGDLVTRTSRTFLVGSTGLGKTMFGLALACGMASGSGFLHWRSTRPARVLYVDGEMPAELIKARSVDALRRSCKNIPPGNLCIFARDLEEQFAKDFSVVGKAAPLNTAEGHAFIETLIEQLGGVDAVIFDNVMSLVAGDQREEIPWSETMPLIEKLTKGRVGQVWLDHTGHNSTRQYGSSTKAWRFDSVGIMEPLAEGDRSRHELAFKLSFDAPGKARRRTPDNWLDFEPCTIRLAEDLWTGETTEAVDALGVPVKRPNLKEAKLRDRPALLLRELRCLVDQQGALVSPSPGQPIVRAVTRILLRQRLIEQGWFSDDLLSETESGATKLGRRGYPVEHNALRPLKSQNFIDFNQEWAWVL